jgi:hypothetical protein
VTVPVPWLEFGGTSLLAFNSGKTWTKNGFGVRSSLHPYEVAVSQLQFRTIKFEARNLFVECLVTSQPSIRFMLRGRPERRCITHSMTIVAVIPAQS